FLLPLFFQGAGTGIAYTPAVVIVAQYFKKYYSVVIALVTTGDSIGIMMFGPLMQMLLDAYGWRGTLLVTGAITANICLAGAVCRSNRRPLQATENRQVNKHGNPEGELQTISRRIQASTNSPVTTEQSAEGRSPHCVVVCLSGAVKVFRLKLLWQSYRFSALCFAQCAFVFSLGCYLVYLIPRATSSGIPAQEASFLLSVVGISGLVGRPFCGLINHKVSSEIIFDASMFTSACAVLVAQFGTYGYFMFSAALFGLAIGFQRTITPVLVREYVGLANLGSAVGLYSGIGGVVDLIGPILAGAIYDVTESYTVLFYIFAGVFALGFLAMLLAPLLKRIEPGVREG
ncbi:monocarboxylate transporter 12-like, partial [Acanthaster planci]|uniref:Monocarboxylate transporter 12-like n=1 Tax=Acanthaster planci TaxID=133434 RepID=A0A8B8A7U0_ACAPL